MSYFQTHYENLSLPIQTHPGGPGLRECQAGAYWAALAHFTASKEPALVALPTGAGKTALMMLLTFGLRAKRVLVITPAVILRDQTYEKFRFLDDLVKSGSFPRDMDRPRVHRQLGRITSRQQWERLSRYDVVISTPHTTSPGSDPSIVEAPEGLFDLVLFDEAHHSRAPSWMELLGIFGKARIVLLTATPFRMDRRRLPGRLIYYYPVGKALETGIYREIIYHPVKSISRSTTDETLCQKSCELLSEERKSSPDAKILIRTATVKAVAPLVKLYESRGIKVREVHYKKSFHENAEVLRSLRENRLDGVVCVGMLGEGLDIPSLKIAALHAPPQSFPFTLQFIGRVSRPAQGQVGPARVVANPEQITSPRTSRELRRLYYEDASWRQLIPSLVKDVVGPLTDHTVPGPGGWALTELRPADIAPFFSATLTRIAPEEINLKKPFDLGEEIEVLEIPYSLPSFRGLVTARRVTPPWATRLDLWTTVYDLHLLYYHEHSKTLFRSTTSERIYSRIEAKLIEDLKKQESLDGLELVRLMQPPAPLAYQMVGMANTLGRAPALPSYKMLLGQDVQAALGQSDGAAYAFGHAFARIETAGDEEKPETRGIGAGTSKVWSIRRDSVDEWIDWCDVLGRELLAHPAATGLRDLPYLTVPGRVRRFDEKPVYAVFCPFWTDQEIELVQGRRLVPVTDPRIEVGMLHPGKERLDVWFTPGTGGFKIGLQYNLAANRWNVTDPAGCDSVKISRGNVLEDEVSLDRLFELLPPCFYLGRGALLQGGQLHEVRPQYERLPPACFLPDLDWKDCDIHVEYEDDKRKAEAGKKSVHDWLQEELTGRKTSAGAVVLKDHAAGEIADFVAVDPESSTLSFYHCKAAPKKGSGAAMSLVQDVLDQVLRNVAWIKAPRLLAEILGRGDGRRGRPASRFVKGDGERLKNLENIFQPALWKYRVVIVQPGLDGRQAVAADNTNLLLLSCFEWLRTVGAELSIWCNYPSKLIAARLPAHKRTPREKKIGRSAAS